MPGLEGEMGEAALQAGAVEGEQIVFSSGVDAGEGVRVGEAMPTLDDFDRRLTLATTEGDGPADAALPMPQPEAPATPADAAAVAAAAEAAAKKAMGWSREDLRWSRDER